MKVTTLLLFLYYCITVTLTAPLDDYSRDIKNDPEDRRFHNRRQRPCRKDANGRTFFDWNYSPINVYNNYNSDCGGGYGQYPIGGGGLHGGGGGLHGGGGLFGGSHHSGGSNHGSGGGIFSPYQQGGGGGQHNVGGNNGGNSGGGGLFGLGLFPFGLFGNNNNYRPSNRPKPECTEAPVAQTDNESDESNDYDDEKPVNEVHDDVVLDRNQNLGGYIQDITNFNPTRVVKRVNKEFNKFFRPLYDLFRK